MTETTVEVTYAPTDHDSYATVSRDGASPRKLWICATPRNDGDDVLQVSVWTESGGWQIVFYELAAKSIEDAAAAAYAVVAP